MLVLVGVMLILTPLPHISVIMVMTFMAAMTVMMWMVPVPVVMHMVVMKMMKNLLCAPHEKTEHHRGDG